MEGGQSPCKAELLARPSDREILCSRQNLDTKVCLRLADFKAHRYREPQPLEPGPHLPEVRRSIDPTKLQDGLWIRNLDLVSMWPGM